MMLQELESVDFYIAQGYSDIAVDTLDMLERQFGPQSEILVRREKLAATNKQAPSPAVIDFGGAEGAESPAPSRPPSKPAATGIDAGLAELFEEFRVAEEEEIGDEDFETHYNMGTAYKEMDLLDEAIHEFQASAALVSPGDGTSRFLQCCNMLGHCLMEKGLPEAAMIWFKKGLAAPGHSEDEYQALRYELATAYERVGDVENARQLYTEVYGIDVSYREVAEKLRKLGKKKKDQSPSL
jgi:tetratricopeptide (TPR) repeat protein